jgi:hypothetical protein
MKLTVSILLFLVVHIGIGIVLPAYMLSYKISYGIFTWDIMPLVFIIGVPSAIDSIFCQKYNTWKRSVVFIGCMVVSFFVAVLLIKVISRFVM